MKTLASLIKSKKFNWVNSNIEKNFKLEEVRNTDYKLFHFDKYVSSKYAIKEIENEGYCPANLAELLNWKDWNDKDFVVALGSVSQVVGSRFVAYLYGSGAERGLDLDWFDCGWGVLCRFLAVRNSTLKPSEISSGPLTLKSAISLCKKEGYQVSKIM